MRAKARFQGCHGVERRHLRAEIPSKVSRLALAASMQILQHNKCTISAHDAVPEGSDGLEEAAFLQDRRCLICSRDPCSMHRDGERITFSLRNRLDKSRIVACSAM